jgi:hypothetical protein
MTLEGGMMACLDFQYFDSATILAQGIELLLTANLKTLEHKWRFTPRAVELVDIHTDLQLRDFDNFFHHLPRLGVAFPDH